MWIRRGTSGKEELIPLSVKSNSSILVIIVTFSRFVTLFPSGQEIFLAATGVMEKREQ
jgi:hypothetical protein